MVTEVQSCAISDLDQQLATIEQRSFRFQSLETFGTELADLVLPQGILRILESMADQRLVVVHDAFASRIPWETMCIDKRFPAVETGLNRRYIAGNLSIAKWLEQRQVGSVLDLLLVVNPTQDLPGAEEEGARIEDLFKSHPAVNIDVLRGSDATKAAVLGAFRSGRYDAVHYAGHAFFDPADPPRSGIFCHGGNVLSGSELAGLAHLPALMFFNACEAGRIRSAQQKRQQELDIPNRLQRSAGLAEAFLRGGLANYLGTYWPVGDLPAKRFAETFYIQLLEGKSMGKALRQGRKELHEMKSLDWADYMHYGSSSFVLKKGRE